MEGVFGWSDFDEEKIVGPGFFLLESTIFQLSKKKLEIKQGEVI